MNINAFIKYNFCKLRYNSICDFIQEQECSKKFYQPGNHKLQAGSCLNTFLSRKAVKILFSLWGGGGTLPQRILKIKGLRFAKNAFLAFQRPYEVVKHGTDVFQLLIPAMLNF